MTTIAYKDGVLAADTRCTIDDVIDQSEHKKVFHLKNGALVGLAGDLGVITAVLKKLRRDPDDFEVIKVEKKELNAIYVRADGKVFEKDSNGWIPVTAKYAATGSGYLAALVAMRCGKSAREAIKIAIEFDKNTGGKVRSVKLK